MFCECVLLRVDDLKSPKHRKLFQIWSGWKGADTVPHKSLIDPIEMGADLLPYLVILEMLDAGKDYRYRLVGTALVNAVDKDFTGETVLSFFGKHDELYVLEGYENSRLSGEPFYDTGDFRDRSREFLTYQRLVLPFEFEGEIKIFLACFDFDGDQAKIYAP